MPSNKRDYQLNHSRHLDLYARQVAENIIDTEASRPTQKQLKYFKVLYARCKDHGLDTSLNFGAGTRIGCGMAIDELRRRLKEAGINPGGNDKPFARPQNVKPLDVSNLSPDELAEYNRKKSQINQRSAPWKEKKEALQQLDAKFAKDNPPEYVLPFWTTVPNEEYAHQGNVFLEENFNDKLCNDCGGGAIHHTAIAGDDGWFARCIYPPSESGVFDPLIREYRKMLKNKNRGDCMKMYEIKANPFNPITDEMGTILKTYFGAKKPFDKSGEITKQGVEAYYALRRLLLDISVVVKEFDPFPAIIDMGVIVGIHESYPTTLNEKQLQNDVTLENILTSMGVKKIHRKRPVRDLFYGKGSLCRVTKAAEDTCNKLGELLFHDLPKLLGEDLIPAQIIEDALEKEVISLGWIKFPNEPSQAMKSMADAKTIAERIALYATESCVVSCFTCKFEYEGFKRTFDSVPDSDYKVCPECGGNMLVRGLCDFFEGSQFALEEENGGYLYVDSIAHDFKIFSGSEEQPGYVQVDGEIVLLDEVNMGTAYLVREFFSTLFHC